MMEHGLVVQDRRLADLGAERVAMSVDTVARVTEQSRAAIYRAMRDGGLKSVKLGRNRRILMVDLQAWLESQRDAA